MVHYNAVYQKNLFLSTHVSFKFLISNKNNFNVGINIQLILTTLTETDPCDSQCQNRILPMTTE